ncbi:TPA: hypothetical protein KPG21_000468 [Clostridioides difficile]|uniref:hypothetical protein n=1 Tax=unclassified Clostridioides TaxID=2635829 RepID=UPI001A34A7B8|nr:hypothetical protein [Clostridioides difficile]MCC0678240.1 hypothetical protein [Clostridioides sp. ES-W-0018-02]MCC0713018.1 hypothetical protein [Clostridioides sp. ES-W-0017-02]MBZ1159208.1 hypothetical protein [Clostridioides difficile]MCL6900156.1 hypothetical protein [Clostridioides difficile]
MNIITIFKKLIKSEDTKKVNDKTIEPSERIFRYEIKTKENILYICSELFVYEEDTGRLFLKKTVLLYNKIFKKIVNDYIYRFSLKGGRFIRMYGHSEEYIMILIKNKIAEQYSKNSKIKEMRQNSEVEKMRQEMIKLEEKGNIVIDSHSFNR